MLALTTLQTVIAVVFVVICVLLILLILIQKGKGGGLSGAFGGVGSYSAFGTKTGDALTWATVVLTGLFLLMAVLANYAYKPTPVPGVGPATTMPIDPEQDGIDLPADGTPSMPAPDQAEELPAQLQPAPQVPSVPPAPQVPPAPGQ